jgi:hypothetical protein
MNTNTSTYNGWTNYATWRVMLEYFDGITAGDLLGEDGRKALPSDCREAVDRFIHEDHPDTHPTVLEWASAFVDRVNWQEIADTINEGGDHV